MRVLIVGTGYVGLVTGVCYAKCGHDVLCVDRDPYKVELLENGIVPIYENGLTELLKEQLEVEKIRFSTSIPQPAPCDVALIAVGTPPRRTGAADLTSVFEVVRELAEKMPLESILGTKSTVPVGTAERIEQVLESMGRSDLRVVSVPEFLREGNAIADTLNPSRLVFGVPDDVSELVLRELHIGIDAPILTCDRSTAEMIKYASNAFLATKISFINEIANICERVGADVIQVAEGMGLDPRIGRSFLRAGLGYGGSCFPKDTRALVRIAGDIDYDFKVLRAVVEVNERQRHAPIAWLRQKLGDIRNKRITLLGVAFKPGTDDVRESPALELAELLKEAGADVRLCDPIVERVFDDVVERDPYQAIIGADAVILVTEWEEFTTLKWDAVYGLMKAHYVFDGRNVLKPKEMEAIGFIFGNVGHHDTRQLVEIG